MDPGRIAALLAPFLGGDTLTPAQLGQLARYLDLLLRWNARINLTAVRDPEQIVTRHFGESLFAARALLPSPALSRAEAHPGSGLQNEDVRGEARVAPSRALPSPPESQPQAPPYSGLQNEDVRGEARVAPSRALPSPSESRIEAPPYSGFQINDLGSGAGFPGLPIKIWAPAARVTLIESQNKKQTFLGETIRLLGLAGIQVFPGRAEDLAATADLVTLRAVEKFQRALPIAARLVSPDGRLALLIGANQETLARNLASHLQWSKPIPVPLSAARILLVGRNRGGHVPEQ